MYPKARNDTIAKKQKKKGNRKTNKTEANRVPLRIEYFGPNTFQPTEATALILIEPNRVLI